MTPHDLHAAVNAVAHGENLGLALEVYEAATLEAIFAYVAAALGRPAGRGRWPWRKEKVVRQPPLLLAGPVGTGKTTLMMLLDCALREQSCRELFTDGELRAHPSAAPPGGSPPPITLRPLALMGHASNRPTGVVRLRQLRDAFRLSTYDRATSKRDPEAAERFAALFAGKIVYIDEFVPDTVSAFPMGVINHLADHGVPVILSSNRRETPFVPGVEVVAVEGEDMRRGELARVVRAAGPNERFDALAALSAQPLDRVARGLHARTTTRDGGRWMHLAFEDLARAPADWLTFQHLLQFADRVVIDGVPIFDPRMEVGPDAVRRFVLLVDALYDERRPVLVRLTSPEPLPPDFDIDSLADRYIPELLVDIERALSRLSQMAELWTE